MEALQELTTVVIIGAGVAGLTAAHMLKRNGVDCVVLERQNRGYLEQRNRAGVVEPRACGMFEKWGLGHVLGGQLSEGLIEFRLNGVTRLARQYPQRADAPRARACPQQILVRNLLAAFIAEGGDLRFNAREVSLHEIASESPVVRYEDETGARREICCRVIAGCDGDRGVSRTAIPETAITRHTEDFGISWLVVLAQVPPARYPIYGMSDHGYAGHFPRGPQMSRYYLQIPPGHQVSDWPDARIWTELKLRLGDPFWPEGPVLEKDVLPLRAVVFLVGDAAHIYSPTGGKGANSAMYDAETLAGAVIDLVRNGNADGLRCYSDQCLRHTWNYQEFSVWLLDLLHDIGDTARGGTFRRGIARARLERLMSSEIAADAYRELMAGLS
jgi:p-hydroxybenzoate 3-monooxygenase